MQEGQNAVLFFPRKNLHLVCAVKWWEYGNCVAQEYRHGLVAYLPKQKQKTRALPCNVGSFIDTCSCVMNLAGTWEFWASVATKGVIMFTVGSHHNPLFYVYIFQILLLFFWQMIRWINGVDHSLRKHQVSYVLLGDIKDKLRSDDDYVRPSCKAALKPPKRGSGPLSVSFY